MGKSSSMFISEYCVAINFSIFKAIYPIDLKFGMKV